MDRKRSPKARTTAPALARLNKLIAKSGVASRRAAEEMIKDGRVTVDGVVVHEVGFQLDPRHAEVTVDGRPLDPPRAPVYVLMHKPRGTVCTADDPEGRERVFDLLPRSLPRLFSVGRLDFNTTGALLLTNDGDLAEALAHPRHRIERVYDVKLRAELPPEAIVALADGVHLDDGTVTESIRTLLLDGDAHAWWYRLTLHEGKNREVRRIFETLGAQVQKLHRVAFAGLDLEGVRPGRSRRLKSDEVGALHELVGLPYEPPVTGGPRAKGRSAQRQRPDGERPERRTSAGGDEPPHRAATGGRPERRPQRTGDGESRRASAGGRPERRPPRARDEQPRRAPAGGRSEDAVEGYAAKGTGRSAKAGAAVRPTIPTRLSRKPGAVTPPPPGERRRLRSVAPPMPIEEEPRPRPRRAPPRPKATEDAPAKGPTRPGKPTSRASGQATTRPDARPRPAVTGPDGRATTRPEARPRPAMTGPDGRATTRPEGRPRPTKGPGAPRPDGKATARPEGRPRPAKAGPGPRPDKGPGRGPGAGGPASGKPARPRSPRR